MGGDVGIAQANGFEVEGSERDDFAKVNLEAVLMLLMLLREFCPGVGKMLWIGGGILAGSYHVNGQWCKSEARPRSATG